MIPNSCLPHTLLILACSVCSALAEPPNTPGEDDQWITWDSGFNGAVQDLVVFDNKLIACGEFGIAPWDVYGKIVAWDGVSWAALGAETDYPSSLVVFRDSLVTSLIASNHDSTWTEVKQWAGFQWIQLGPNFNEMIVTSAVFQKELIVAGYFDSCGNQPMNHIAAWDGSNWHPLGLGLDESVASMVEFHDKLVVSGYFNIAGTASVHGLAVWDGNTWAPLDTEYMGWEGLTVYDGKLILGGNSRKLGDAPIMSVKAWDGLTWSTLSNGLDSAYASRFAQFDGDLYAGGGFWFAGDSKTHFIAKWDGSSWYTLGSGTNWSAEAMCDFQGKLAVGGHFTRAGGNPSYYFAQWSPSIVAGVNVEDNGALPSTAQLFQNYPNPFNPSTEIEFSLPHLERVTVKIYNALGQTIRTLLRDTPLVGVQHVKWDGRDDAGATVATGVYCYLLQAGDKTLSKKMVLLK